MQVHTKTEESKNLEFELQDLDNDLSTPNLKLTIKTAKVEEKTEWVKKIEDEINSLQRLRLALGNPKQEM